MSRTKTSDFGATKRESHDSSHFYSSKMYTEITPANTEDSDGLENPLPKTLENKIIQADSRDLSFIPDLSLHLIVTSPPYNARKQYDDDLSLSEYLKLIEEVCTQIYPKLVDGGRIILNIANMGRKPYIPITDYISHILTDIGYMQRGEIIWDKGASAGSSTAWGSWLSASNPSLRDVHEYILIFSKGTMKRTKGEKVPTISRDEFLKYTKSIWQFSTVSARKIGHPAPFPEELPYRCIQLYSYEDDVIFDPFMGSGSTALAALKSGRRYVGIELKQDYVDLA
ncbi:MAG: site-specific DNA-methyltransferase, partial [Candidatus Heimdallarchaeota archaeon]|nr:site-specific DNA-methyltransferase [Candidatus Heimdallarchaeota archaeon]